jgi:glycosyltransferase involved in cell wall biosynthesis
MKEPTVKDGRIKVFYLINSMAMGGAERQMAELVRRLPRDRFEPVLCSLSSENAYPQLLPSDQPRYVIEQDMRWRGGIELRRILRREQPDVVHSFMEWSNLWNRLLAPGVGRPVVISSVRSRMMRPDYRLVEALLATRCDAVVVNSIGTREELIHWQRVPARKIRVIGNFLDLARFPIADAHAREAARNRFQLIGMTFLIPGRISISKHHLGLVLAAGALRRRGRLPPDVQFLLAGRVYDKTIGLAMRMLIKAQKLERHFQILGKVQEIAELYAASDWVLLPSLYEGLPNAALEAHSCARPLLISRSANLDGIVEPGVTGLEFDTWRVGPMVEAIESALVAPDARIAEMGRAGRSRVENMFRCEDVLRAVTDLYEEQLARRRGCSSA